MKQWRWLFPFISAVILFALLAGCAPAAQPAPAANPQAQSAATTAPAQPAPAAQASPAPPKVYSGTGGTGGKDLKKVKIAVATSIMNVSYPWLMLPLALGYWRDAGYDVSVLPVGGSLQAVQQLVGGGVDLVQINSAVVEQANTKDGIPLRVVMDNGVIDWALIVPEDSPIKDVKDFKGKSIGVFNLASGGIPYMKAYLTKNGLDPENDVSLIPVGYGAPALDAVKSGKVAGLMLWASAIGGLENMGGKFRYFRGDDWKGYPDFALATTQDVIDKNPEMVQAIAQGAVKATLFALSNPDCAIKVHWTNFPDTKPTGADEATLAKWDRHSLDLQLDTLRWAYELHGSKNWGTATAPEYSKLQDFLFDNKLIDKKVDPNTFLINIPNFYDKINNVDAAAIKAQAENCAAK